jgi:hypothetical protein
MLAHQFRFYSSCNQMTITHVALDRMLCCHTSCRDPKFSITSIAPIARVRVSAMLLSLIIGYWNDLL